ncbi:MAG TPA: hotdog fold thioesterase [Steroidobacteraceae bacterium]|nr:hotdog fold thioesterase [Steroidobacteraceae bacterium]HRX90304.1 hotdog fold thioesterase [Steroidobacteraceae bacterium]
MRIWLPDVTLDKFIEVEANTAADHAGVVLTKLGDDFLRGTLEVNQRSAQTNGSLHGGASAILAESLASLAANGVVDRDRFVCLGQQINLNHLRPVPVGTTITGTTRAHSIEETTQVWGVDIVDAADRLVCVGRVMMAVVPRPANAAKFF